MLTEPELYFIRQNYQILGGTDCARKLSRSRHAVVTNAKAMGLGLTHEHRSNIMKRKLDKPFNKRNVNPSSFIIPEQMNAVNAYLLGFIWADGHVSFRHSACRISARFVTDDSPDLLPLFQKTGRWGIYTQHPKSCREATVVETNNRPLAEFLNNMDYITKSSAPATKILDVIPTHLRRHWWRGCFDGDGCFYVGKRYDQISLFSTYEQDWSHFSKLCEEIGITYTISKTIRKKGKSSSVRVSSINGMAKLIHYLYPNGFEFGLKRKFLKSRFMSSVISRS